MALMPLPLRLVLVRGEVSSSIVKHGTGESEEFSGWPAVGVIPSSTEP